MALVFLRRFRLLYYTLGVPSNAPIPSGFFSSYLLPGGEARSRPWDTMPTVAVLEEEESKTRLNLLSTPKPCAQIVSKSSCSKTYCHIGGKRNGCGHSHSEKLGSAQVFCEFCQFYSYQEHHCSDNS